MTGWSVARVQVPKTKRNCRWTGSGAHRVNVNADIDSTRPSCTRMSDIERANSSSSERQNSSQGIIRAIRQEYGAHRVSQWMQIVLYADIVPQDPLAPGWPSVPTTERATHPCGNTPFNCRALSQFLSQAATDDLLMGTGSEHLG